MSYLSSYSVIVSLNRYVGFKTVSMRVQSTLSLLAVNCLCCYLSVVRVSLKDPFTRGMCGGIEEILSSYAGCDARYTTKFTSFISLFCGVQLERAFFLSKDQASLSLCPAS